jgi:hypothetical protein
MAEPNLTIKNGIYTVASTKVEKIICYIFVTGCAIIALFVYFGEHGKNTYLYLFITLFISGVFMILGFRKMVVDTTLKTIFYQTSVFGPLKFWKKDGKQFDSYQLVDVVHKEKTLIKKIYLKSNKDFALRIVLFEPLTTPELIEKYEIITKEIIANMQKI